MPLVTELPPMRMPVLGNVLQKKTGGRLKWYVIEVILLFLIGTLIMFGSTAAARCRGSSRRASRWWWAGSACRRRRAPPS